MGRSEELPEPGEARRLVRRGADALHLRRRLSRDLRCRPFRFEDRFIAIGPIARGIVVVVYTERDEGVVRIIGARMATGHERELYRSHRKPYR